MARLLVRTWNAFHGRTVPPAGRACVDEAVRLVSEDGPAVVCLQELPVWAVERLEAWTGMGSHAAVTAPALGGPLARRLTAVDPDRLRSALTGQANAVLVARDLFVLEATTLDLNPRRFRRGEERRRSLPSAVARHWGANRRAGQFLRIERGSCSFVVVNLHLTSSTDSRPAEAELERALAFAEGFARPGEPVILCGDMNLTPASSAALRALPAAGFSRPMPGIDQILVRGLALTRAPEPWPEIRRRHGAYLLSDHAPVEAEMMCP